MYNKRLFNKVNDKKVLHKVKKQWVTISLAMLMMIGGGAVATHVSASANTTTKPQVTTQSNKKPSRTITDKANNLHKHLLAHAATKATAQKPKKVVNLSKLPNKNKKVNKVNKVNNVNRLHVNQSGLYKGNDYKRVTTPFNSVRINHRVLLHSNINSVGSLHNKLGTLHQGRVVRVIKAFEGYFNNDNYLRYEVPLTARRNAFITGSSKFVSYVAPTYNYHFYQKKLNHLLAHSRIKGLNGVRKMAKKANRKHSKNYKTYMKLYVKAFTESEAYRKPVIIAHHGHKAVAAKKQNTTNNQPSLVNSLENSNSDVNYTSSSEAYSYAPASYTPASFVPTPYVPVVTPPSNSTNESSVAPSSASTSSESVAPSSANSSASSASAKSMSSASSSASKSVSSASTSSSAASKVPSSSNQPAIKKGIYNGLNYTYNPSNNSINFLNGKLDVTSRGAFLNNDATPSDIRDADTVAFGDIDLNNISDMNNMFADDQNVKDLNLGDSFNTKSVSNMSNMFRSDTNLQSLHLGNGFDTSNVSDMSDMFANDGNLTSLTLPAKFNTKVVNNNYNNDNLNDGMSNMFSGDSDLSSLTIQSPDTKFNSNSDLNSVDGKPSWTNQNNSAVSNLGDGKSHTGTWNYKPYKNNTPANNVIPKNVNIETINNNVKSQISRELGSTPLSSKSAYSQLANSVARGADSSWSESDLTLSPNNILGPSSDSGTNMFNKAYYDSDNQNKELVRVSEENLHLISINGVGIFSDASDTNPSDFLPNKIIGDSQSVGDRDFDGIHTIVKYSGPISISNNSTNDGITNELVNAFNATNVSKEQLKYAKYIGLGYKYHNGNLYEVLVIGPNNPSENTSSNGSSSNTPSNNKKKLITYSDVMNHSSIVNHLEKSAILLGMYGQGATNTISSHFFSDMLGSSDRESDDSARYRRIVNGNAKWLKKAIDNHEMPPKSGEANLLKGWSVDTGKGSDSKGLLILTASDVVNGIGNGISALSSGLKEPGIAATAIAAKLVEAANGGDDVMKAALKGMSLTKDTVSAIKDPIEFIEDMMKNIGKEFVKYNTDAALGNHYYVIQSGKPAKIDPSDIH